MVLCLSDVPVESKTRKLVSLRFLGRKFPSEAMSFHECELIELLLDKYFGKIVARVGSFLCKNGGQTLRSLVKKAHIPRKQINNSLCILIKHKFIVFCDNRKEIEYRFVIERGLHLIYVPRVIYIAATLYQDIGETIIKEMIAEGIAKKDFIISRVIKSHEERGLTTSVGTIEKKFQDLQTSRFVITEPKINSLEEEHTKEEDDGPVAKKMKLETKEDSCWSVNYMRFFQYFRDQIIVDGISHQYDTSCGEIVRTMLRISEITTSPTAGITQPISTHEIVHALPAKISLSPQYVEQYLNLMVNDLDSCIQRPKDDSNDMFIVNLKKAVASICIENVLSYIQERHGNKCCRIFRLLLAKQHLEQKQVEDFAMIPSKEAKEYLYSMLAENLLVMQEIAKTTDHAPSRTFYLFSVVFPKTVRTLLARCYQILKNVLVRNNHAVHINTRLIEKEEKMNAIKRSLKDSEPDQLEEIEEMLTAAEKSQLSKLTQHSDKLGKSHLQIANTIFVLNQYLKSLS